MSRSTPRETGSSNPIKVDITFKPNDGEFHIYDKDTKEKKVGIKKLKLVILEGDMKSVTGFSEANGAGFTSNYVRNPAKEDFKVGVFKDKKYTSLQEGKWKDIKDKLVGASFARSVFVLVESEGEWKFGKLELKGKAGIDYGDWFSANKAKAEDDFTIIEVGDTLFMKDAKSGGEAVVPEEKKKKWMTTWYHKLDFSFEPITVELAELAMKQSKVFDAWIDKEDSSVAENATVSENVTGASSPTAEDEDDDDLPF